MPVLGILLFALGVWLLDSAVRNRAPIATLKQVISTGSLPQTGVTFPSGSSTSNTTSSYAPPSSFDPTGSSNPSSNTWNIGSDTNGYTGTSYDEPNYPRPAGNLADWIQQASSVLAANGDAPLSSSDISAIQTIVQNESGGDPLIINGWDINAQNGHPSKGLMQDIPSTFERWAVAGHHDIFNPVDNIVASVRYSRGRYGSLSNVPGVVSTASGGGYRPY